ncbi:hypothetical protein BG004_003201 [Podila humilis]|nr:hypothetical protein BG004_003201 [Podila humilis]
MMFKLLFFVASISTVMAYNRITFWTDINGSGKKIYCAYQWDKCYKFPENFGLSSWTHTDHTAIGSGGISVSLFDDTNCGRKFTRWAIKQDFGNIEQADYFPNGLNDNVRSFQIKDEKTYSESGMTLARLKAMFAPRRRRYTTTTTRPTHRNHRRGVAIATTPRRRYGAGGLFSSRAHRRRPVIATAPRRHVSTKARLLAALRPRPHRRTRATRTAPVRSRYGHGLTQHHHSGSSKLAALLGLAAMKNRRTRY